MILGDLARIEVEDDKFAKTASGEMVRRYTPYSHALQDGTPAMLTNLRIKNFKAWKDTGEVRLAPITVFFGGNSAGKSSLLQFLLMLRQTVESPDRSAEYRI